MQNDPWVFNYRSHFYDYSDSDADSDSDYSFRTPKSKISDECRLRSELDISTRPDAAVFKSNPFSIAKTNAFTRSSRPIVAAPTQVAEKPKNTGTIHAFVGKTVRKEPAACKVPFNPGGCNLVASSQSTSTTRRNTEQQPSNLVESCMNRSSNSSNRFKLNVVETSSNRPHQVDANLTRPDPDIQPVSSSKNMPHIPVPAYAQGEPLVPVYAKTVLFPSQDSCSNHQVTAHGIRAGKSNQPVVLLEDPYPPASPRDEQKSQLPIISSKNRKERSGGKSNHASGITSAISPITITRTRYAPTKRLVNSSEVDSMAHMSTSTVRKELNCYEAKLDEDESWSTLPPRKKFKPRFPPLILMLIFDLRSVSCMEACNLCPSIR
jgi:hypothetical protein